MFCVREDESEHAFLHIYKSPSGRMFLENSSKVQPSAKRPELCKCSPILMIRYFLYIVAFGDVWLKGQQDQTFSSLSYIYLHIYSIFVDVCQLQSTVGKLLR